jgi:hypothetical protein
LHGNSRNMKAAAAKIFMAGVTYFSLEPCGIVTPQQ